MHESLQKTFISLRSGIETDDLMMPQPLRFCLKHFHSANCVAFISVACVWLGAGCSEPRGPVSVKSDDPTLKIPAIKEDVQRKNSGDVVLLVQNLNDDDSAVRFYAIEGLRRLTGADLGYRYYDDDEQRQPALDRWNQWLKLRGGK
jgi:hypothetical protein